MEIVLLTVGKTSTDFVRKGIEEYDRRIRRYTPFSLQSLPDVRNTRALSEDQQKKAEGELILNYVKSSDYLVLLDEHGLEFTSLAMASWLEKRMAAGNKRLIFAVGGPYGFSPAVYDRADAKLSLSRLTFPHELVRLFFAEQLYRCFTILRGEPYHHE